MQLRHVVSSFLVHPEDGTILLGRRSDRVGTYPGYWAAVSGAVEAAEPLEQALREIEEETGLDRTQVELRAEGRPLRFADWDLGTVWVVHPFLFRCLAPQDVRPDWEHARFEWLSPSRIPDLRTVPKLLDAYQAVAYSAGPLNSSRVFEMVRDDRVHGAEELGLWTLEGLRRAAGEALAVSVRPDQVLCAMRSACRGRRPPTRSR